MNGWLDHPIGVALILFAVISIAAGITHATHWSTNGAELHPGADPDQCRDCIANRRYPCCDCCKPEHHAVIPANEHTLACTTCQGGGV